MSSAARKTFRYAAIKKVTKKRYRQAVSTIPSNFEGWTVGNVVLDGIVGFGVDAATGAINQYPHTFQVPMQPVIAAK